MSEKNKNEEWLDFDSGSMSEEEAANLEAMEALYEAEVGAEVPDFEDFDNLELRESMPTDEVAEAAEDTTSASSAEYVSAFSVAEHASEKLLHPTLLEASAGTGKTFSIKHLVLRLIVEHNKAIDKILVVTFTRAATAELSTRIREHLADTVRYVEACRRVLEEVKNETPPSVDVSLAEIAEDPVDFAKKAGLETAGLEAAVKGTDGLIVGQVKSWVSMMTGTDSQEDDKRVPLTFDVQLSRLRRALSNFDNAAIYTIHSFCRQMLSKHAFSASGALEWNLMSDDADFRSQAITDFLRGKLADRMNNPEERRALVTDVKWDTILREIQKLPAELARREVAACDLKADIEAFINEVPPALEKLKADAGIHVYDDLLITMWKTINAELHDKTSEFAFVKSVRAAYQAVLIDEFQDTDPVQYEVFKALFLPENPDDWKNGALFFVGDPKQAIYSFRSADLNTYFRAKEDLEHLKGRRSAVIANLPKNYRSSPRLVAAVNALFTYPEVDGEAPKPAFLNEKLDFKPVESQSTNTGLYLWKDCEWTEMDPFVLRLGDDFEKADSATEAEVRAVTADMVMMIQGGQKGRIALKAESFEEGKGLADDRPHFVMLNGNKKIPLRALEPRDIAILCRGVRNNEALESLRRSLDTHGIRTRLFDDSHICMTAEAEELLTVLHAYAAPDDERAVRAARTTRLIGETLNDLEREDDAHRTELRLFLEEGRRQWSRRGLAPILGELMTKFRTAERLLPTKGGEQTITNFAHLIEILHNAGKRYNAPAGLIAWFESAMRNPPGGDDSWEVRLASDANLVTVWTIHRSKGLQYPVVYLPFTKTLCQKPPKAPVLRIYENGQMMLKIWPDQCSNEEAFSVDVAEENIRLAYVALTRAACRIVMTASYPEKISGRGIAKESCAYWQLLMGQPFKAEQWPEVREKLTKLDDLGFIKLDDLMTVKDLEGRSIDGCIPTVESVSDQVELKLGPSTSVYPAWYKSSFTGLTRMMSDDGETTPVFGARFKPDLTRENPTMLDFPRGTQAGDTLHRMLEVADFQKLALYEEEPARKKLAENVIRSHMSAFESPLHFENAVRAASDMIYDVLNAEILPGVRLKDIKPAARAAEMEFLLSMPKGLTAKRLGEWLAKADPRYAVSGLDEKTLAGYLTGFIDLTFMDHNRRFWILDWKSNAIAEHVNCAEDYTEEVMAAEMTKHHYRLQYLIYLVALRRFLKLRLGDAWCEDVIGGAVYVFLRGVKASAERGADGHLQGVVLDPVPPKLIANMDVLFSDDWKTLFAGEAEC